MTSSLETSMLVDFDDPRPSDLREAHATIVRHALARDNARIRDLIRANPEQAPPQADFLEGYLYDCEVSLAGFLYVMIGVSFKTSGQLVGGFSGKAGGVALGSSKTSGTAGLNFPVETIRGIEARFEVNFNAFLCNVHWWKMDGTRIGSFVGVGIEGAGGGIIGGQGNF